jgi:uncharacterized protein (DUF2252 family)
VLRKVEHLSVEQRIARGESARDRLPPSSHHGWLPSTNRRDPVELIEEQNASRDADLVPVRHGRMMASPFTFYRGTAKIMAADLAGTPTAGLDVQLCGDAHLSNFGVFGSPDRRLVFDINDFDETLPGPFEYDVKRLAASMTVAAYDNRFSSSEAQAVTRAAVTAYREAMAEFSTMRALDVWYTRLSEDELRQAVGQRISALKRDEGHGGGKGKAKGKAREAQRLQKRFEKNLAKARSRDSRHALAKLTEVVDGSYRIRSDPPFVVPARELHDTYGIDREQLEGVILRQMKEYRRSLQPDRRRLLENYEVVDWARKVVGVGSVGTRAFMALLEGRDAEDPLFLQIKEATASVLEGPLPRSRYSQPGERVVQGQRMMQAASDIFLGWSRGEGAGRHYYWRQLRDMKGSAHVELMPPEALTSYGRICGWTMARAHARSGDPVAIAAYLGPDDAFDRAITDFSQRYAEQNDRDFASFSEAIRTSRIEALPEV